MFLLLFLLFLMPLTVFFNIVCFPLYVLLLFVRLFTVFATCFLSSPFRFYTLSASLPFLLCLHCLFWLSEATVSFMLHLSCGSLMVKYLVAVFNWSVDIFFSWWTSLACCVFSTLLLGSFYFYLFDAKNWLIGKDPDAGKNWGQEEKGATEDEMFGLHHRVYGYEFEQTPGDGEGQGSLACCSSSWT